MGLTAQRSVADVEDEEVFDKLLTHDLSAAKFRPQQ